MRGLLSDTLHYRGMMVIESREAVEWREDWSAVRSPGRARRRRRMGHPQRIVRTGPHPLILRAGNTIVAHPDIVAKIRLEAHNASA